MSKQEIKDMYDTVLHLLGQDLLASQDIYTQEYINRRIWSINQRIRSINQLNDTMDIDTDDSPKNNSK